MGYFARALAVEQERETVSSGAVSITSGLPLPARFDSDEGSHEWVYSESGRPIWADQPKETMMGTNAAGLTNEQVFNAAYFAAQPPAVQAVLRMPTGSAAEITARQQAAIAAAKLGYLIDSEIGGFGWSAYGVMLRYQQYGYVSVNNILQPDTLPPGISWVPGSVLGPYVPNAPGSIKVSRNLADYPPFAPAPVPVPVTVQPYLGALLPGQSNEYYTDDQEQNGFVVTTSAGTFVKFRQVVAGPFGPWVVQYYVKQ